MRFPDDVPVTPGKLQALRARIAELGIDLGRVEEQAIRGSGPGGQKVNKTSSGVRLAYLLGEDLIQVKWIRERSRALNRFLALRELCDEIEARLRPESSERERERARIRKRKDSRAAASPRVGERATDRSWRLIVDAEGLANRRARDRVPLMRRSIALKVAAYCPHFSRTVTATRNAATDRLVACEESETCRPPLPEGAPKTTPRPFPRGCPVYPTLVTG